VRKRERPHGDDGQVTAPLESHLAEGLNLLLRPRLLSTELVLLKRTCEQRVLA
jgi:hypothetical protein